MNDNLSKLLLFKTVIATLQTQFSDMRYEFDCKLLLILLLKTLLKRVYKKRIPFDTDICVESNNFFFFLQTELFLFFLFLRFYLMQMIFQTYAQTL